MSEYIIDWDEKLVIDTFSKNSLREEIVRCRDCRFFNCLWVDCYVCKRNGEKFMPFVEPDGFCAWGERGKNEHSEHTTR